MSKLYILILSLFALSTLAQKDYPTEKGVLILGEKNFEDALKEFEYIMVEFYAPWCGHCKQLAPEYAKAAALLQEKGSKARLAKVDATIEKLLAQKYGVTGYPTIFWFDHGDHSKYEAGRTDRDIYNWVRLNSEPISVFLQEKTALDAQVNTGKVAGVFWADDSHPQFFIFERVAKFLRDQAWFYSNSTALKTALGAPSNVLFSVFRNFDDYRVDFQAEITETFLREFVNLNSKPLVATFSPIFAKKIFGDRTQDALLLFRKSQNEALVQELKVAAENIRKEITLIDVSVETEIGKKALANFGLDDTQVPVLGLVHFTDSKEAVKYISKGEINAEKIQKFHESYKLGKLQRFLKSEPVPEKQEGPVKVAVGSTFRQMTQDSRRDVAVFLYAPWCKHCNEFKAVWDTVATKLASIKDLVFVKIDATANEIEGMEVKSYPTILFYPSNNKSSPVKFTEKRTEENVWNWLKPLLTVKADLGSVEYEAKAKNQEL